MKSAAAAIAAAVLLSACGASAASAPATGQSGSQLQAEVVASELVVGQQQRVPIGILDHNTPVNDATVHVRSFVLNGTKHFISNGSMADWYVTFATADRKLKHKGISCFVFPANLPGITRRRMHGKLGQRAADTGEIVYDEVRIPANALVGREGEGF